MKQLQIIVRPTTLDDVLNSLREEGVGGLTLMDVQGEGRADPPLVGDTYSMKHVSVVVPDEKVKKVFESVSKISCSGNKGDGKIFVTDVDDALDLCTKKTGTEAI